MASTFHRIYNGPGAAVDFEVQVQQNIATNESTVYVTAYGIRTNGSYYGYRNGVNFSLTIDGASSSKDWSFNVANWTVGKRYLIHSFSKVIKHNADGSKPNIAASAYCATGTSTFGTINGSLSIALPTIPRQSKPTLSASSVYLGAPLTVTFNPAVSSFKHSIRVQFMNRVGWIDASGNPISSRTLLAGASQSVTLPTSWASSLTNKTSNGAYFDVYTYDASGTQIGTYVRLIPTIMIPTNMVPSISSLGLSYTDAVGGYNLQGITRVSGDVAATGSNGSTITGYVVEVDGANYSARTFSHLLQIAGTRAIKATVTDSRGRKASLTNNVSVLAYNAPQIKAFSVARDSTDPSKVNATYTVTHTAAGTANPLTLKIRYKAKSSSTWIEVSASGTAKTLTGFDTALLYDFELVASDTKRTSRASTSISSVGVPFLIHPNKKSVGINKKPSGLHALEVGGDIQFDGGIIPTRIPAGSDLNNYQTDGVGFYYCPLSADASTMLNCPTVLAFSLLVERHAGRKQTITEYYASNPKTWIRNSDGTAWCPWYQVSMIRDDNTGGMLIPGLSQGFSHLVGSNNEMNTTHYWIDGRAVTVTIQMVHAGTTQGFKTPFGMPLGYRPLTTVRFLMKCDNRIEYGTIGLDGLFKFWTEAGEKIFVGQVTFLV